jgi:peptidoglycan/xylan/chitin deacetylase (PgdA/CDA1 family)
MRPFAPITLVAFLAVAGVWLVPFELRAPLWAGILVVFVALLGWGVLSMRSGIFGRARTAGDRSGSRVALTYDDGPDPAVTGALLDLLRERGCRATFFVVGRKVRAHPELVRRAVADGHLIGNHSEHHAPLTNFFGPERMAAEIGSCQEAVLAATGASPLHYRPPIGLMSASVEPAARRFGLELVGWSNRSLDTVPGSAERVARRVLLRLRPGDIVLLHDARQERERVLEITTRILDGLAVRGLQPVRVDELESRYNPDRPS